MIADLLKLRRINALGTWWKIAYVIRKRDDGWCGDCNSATQTIHIRRGMTDAMTVRTICHELMHAMGMGEQAAGHAEILAGILMEQERG